MYSSPKFFVPRTTVVAGGLSRPRERGREQADHDRDTEGDRKCRLGGTASVLTNHFNSFRMGHR